MLTLILLRHAKSSWSNPGLADVDRPLATRGLNDAPLMGKAMAERFLGVDRRRPLPRFARQSLGAWFRERQPMASSRRGDVVFFADSFSSYTEPEIGIAAIELLERAGWRYTFGGLVRAADPSEPSAGAGADPPRNLLPEPR